MFYNARRLLVLLLAMVLALGACNTPGDTTADGQENGSTSGTVSAALSEKVDTYFTIASSRDPDVEIPIGVTVPALKEGETCPVVVLVHGFLGSKDEEFGFFANAGQNEYPYESMADRLLEFGIGTIRADQPGSGESKDDFRNYTLNNSVSDIQDAFNYCMEKYPFDSERVGLVGWSMGGKVGPKFISQNSNISTMVLLNPAGDNGNTSLLTAAGAGLDWENLNKVAQAEGEVYNETASSFAGRKLVMSKEFFDQMNASVTGDEIISFINGGGHGMMIYGDKDSVINPETYQWMTEFTGIESECIPEMDHDLGLESNRPDFTEKVLDMTVAFLAGQLAVTP